jgi:hypothetical protein
MQATIRPALWKKRNHATAEIFVCLNRACLIAKGVRKQCKRDWRASRGAAMLCPTLEQDRARLKRMLFSTADAIADCHSPIPQAGIKSLRQDPGLAFL